ncbi:MAG: DUF1552 domain-containing protein [Sandaracinaceae bacterium]
MSKLGRRVFLSGLGASAALAATRLQGGARAQATAKKRFVFVLSGNGYDAQVTMSPAIKDHIASTRGRPVSEAYWWGEGYAEGYYATDQSAPVALSGALDGAPGLRAFEAAGLLDKCAMVYGLSSAITGGGHSASHGVLSSTRTIAGRPGGETIEHALADLETVRGTGNARAPLSAIRVGATKGQGGINYGLCASARGAAVPVLNAPDAAWSAYVRPFVDPMGRESLDYRQRLLELSQRDAMRAVAELGDRNVQAQAMLRATSDQLDDLDVFRERVETMSGRLTFAPAAPGAMDTFEYKQFQMDVIASTLEADLARVAVLSLGAGASGWDFPYDVGPLTTADSSHGALYHPYNGPGETSDEMDTKAQRRSELREVWSRELDVVASLAQKLDSLPEPDGGGTMLDHTVITYVADNGVGHHANARDYPLLIVGGGGLGLETGNRAIFYPDVRNTSSEGRRELVNLWSTYAVTLAGGTAGRDGCLAGFGDLGSRIAGGVLPELIA